MRFELAAAIVVSLLALWNFIRWKRDYDRFSNKLNELNRQWDAAHAAAVQAMAAGNVAELDRQLAVCKGIDFAIDWAARERWGKRWRG